MTKTEIKESLERPSGLPMWAAVLAVTGGLGGLGLGGAQFARSPTDIDDKLTAIVAQVSSVGTKIDVLTTQVAARDKSDDRERARMERELDELKARVKTLEDRKNGR